jgi:hypothetical protein
LLDECGGNRAAAEAVCEKHLDEQNTKKRKKDEPLTREAMLRNPLSVELPKGRAPHTRQVMREVVEFIFSTDQHPAEEDGPLYRSEAIRHAQLKRALDEQTNNHLVRHRLKILERLHADLLKEYVGDNRARITRINIEVNQERGKKTD